MRLRNPLEYLHNPGEPREVSADRFFIEAIELFSKWYDRAGRVQLWLNEENLWVAQAGFLTYWPLGAERSKGHECYPPRETISDAVNSVQHLYSFRTRKHRTRIKPGQEENLDQLLRFLLGILNSRREGHGYSMISIGATSSWKDSGRRSGTTFDVTPYVRYAGDSTLTLKAQGLGNVTGSTLEEALLKVAAEIY